MKRLFYIFLVLILTSCGAQQTATISSDAPKGTSSVTINVQSIISQMENAKYKEGELLVKFKSDVVTASSFQAHQKVGSSVVKRFARVQNLERVKLPQGLSVKDAVIQYMSDPNVEYAEPNYIRSSMATIPSDTFFGQQWALNNTGQYAGGTNDADIDAPEAWDIARGSSTIIIAVLDTGIDYNHSDLMGNIWVNYSETSCIDGIDNDANGYIDDCKGWNFVNNNNDPMDDNGHGTHVAGIAGAVGNNGVGVSGVMWNVRLMALKFLDSDGYGTVADEIEAIQYAISKGAKIMNASFGGYGYSQAEWDAIASANAAQILFIAAAGNGGDDAVGDNNDLTPFYPASYSLPNIISVTATDQNDMRASFANFGWTVHVAAPGVYILSTVPTHLYPTGYNEFNMGTSMSAPHVSGIAGLLYSYYDGIHNTQFSYSQVRSTIFSYVDILPTLAGWIQTGGRVNAYRAVSSLLTPTNLNATALSHTQISLTWSDNATGEAGYKLERKTGSNPYTEIATLPAGSSSYTDSSLTPQTTYTYRVKAYNTISQSFYSNEKSATTPAEPAVPTGGGGGCSIGAKQNMPTAMTDLAVMLIPVLFIAVLRLRKRG